ncbi:MAG: EamA-like transporter family protein [Lentisphaerae bacterium ADurb.BinA184]|nr:MAG: EamA-like transporter family protein [Lentisphaerae bacterium ADurb.BinA184]
MNESSRHDETRLGAGRHGLLALLAGAALIACAPILVRRSPMAPLATATWRFILALPVMWAWMWLEPARGDQRRRPQGWRDFGLLAVAGLMFAGDMALWNWSVVLTSVANATLFPNFAPVFVAVGAWLLFRERITSRFLAGLAVAVAGAVLLAGASRTLGQRHVLGDLLGLGTAVFYAGYMLAIKELRRRFLTAAMGEPLWPPTARAWLVLLALAVLVHVLGQGLIAYAFAHLRAGFASLGLLLQPVVAALLAWALLGEAPLPLQAVGGALVLLGIAVARRQAPALAAPAPTAKDSVER